MSYDLVEGVYYQRNWMSLDFIPLDIPEKQLTNPSTGKYKKCFRHHSREAKPLFFFLGGLHTLLHTCLENLLV